MADSHRGLSRLWTWPSVPPAPQQAIVAFVLMFGPAGLGAVLDWPWWVSLLGAMTGGVLYVFAGWRAARERGVLSHRDGPQPVLLIVAFASIPVGFAVTYFVPLRYVALWLPVLVLAFDLLSRVLWRRHDRGGRA